MEMWGAVGMQNLVPGDAQMLLYVCTTDHGLLSRVSTGFPCSSSLAPLVVLLPSGLYQKEERLPSRSKRAPPDSRKHACIL